MSKAAEDLVGQIVMAIVGVFILIFSLFVLAIVEALHSARQKRRVDAMTLKARELGLKFDPKQNRNTANQFRFLNNLENSGGGSESHSLNIASGDYGGHPVTLFDYYWLSSDGSVWWWAPSWKRHNYVSFIVINLGARFPELTLAREGFFSKIAQAVGFNDIDFESSEFSKRYLVRSKDKKFAYDFCNPQMIDYLLDQPTVAIEVEGRALAIGFDSQYRVDEVEPNLGHLSRIRSLMPAYLFDDGFRGQDRVVRQSSGPSIPILPDSSESRGESSPSEQDYLKSDHDGYRWTAFYRGYLLLAALSGLITLMSGLIGSGFMALLSIFTVMAIAKISLFVFAFYSLSRPSETWTRNFHIAINGAAVVMPLILVTGIYRYLPIQSLNFLLWLPVPDFHSIVPFDGWVVRLLGIAVAAAWLYFWVQLARSEKTDPYRS